jgi:hypothetical protein
MARSRSIRQVANVTQADRAIAIGIAKSTTCGLEARPPAAVGRDPDGHRQRWVAILAVLDATNGDAGSAMPSWLTCCPPAARATAPARSNAPPPATTSATRNMTRTVPASP